LGTSGIAHYNEDSALRFLDPNYGVCAYPNWKGVAAAILYLYTEVYNWTQTPPVQNIPFNPFKLQIDVFRRSSQ
jgi:hypothetical protein